MDYRIAIIGSGSWGTALARLLGNKYGDVMMWAYEPDVAASINGEHKNSLFLTDVELPLSISATNDISQALKGRCHQGEEGRGCLGKGVLYRRE